MAPNRKQRAEIAKETLRIIEDRKYSVFSEEEGKEVEIKLEDALEKSINNSQLFTTSELNSIREGFSSSTYSQELSDRHIDVTDEFSIQCCLRLRTENPDLRIACLNFASAKNPGGGMLSGSLAQEESLGLCSTLYPTLILFQVLIMHA